MLRNGGDTNLHKPRLITGQRVLTPKKAPDSLLCIIKSDCILAVMLFPSSCVVALPSTFPAEAVRPVAASGFKPVCQESYWDCIANIGVLMKSDECSANMHFHCTALTE